jgi:hypothetical protein
MIDPVHEVLAQDQQDQYDMSISEAELDGYLSEESVDASELNAIALEPGMSEEDYFTSEELEFIRLKDYIFLQDMESEGPEAYIEDEDILAQDNLTHEDRSEYYEPLFGTYVHSWAHTVLAVARFVQERYYWCGPASTQMLQYYFDQPCSQAYIAWREGTTKYGTSIYRIAGFLNESPMTGYKFLPSWWRWEVFNVSGSKSLFENKIRWAQYYYKAPQIYWVYTNPAGTWGLPGWTSNWGHYVVGYGYDYRDFSNKKVHYHDPYYSQGGGTRVTTTANMWNCIKARNGRIVY